MRNSKIQLLNGELNISKEVDGGLPYLRTYIYKCRSLNFHDTPNYKELKHLAMLFFTFEFIEAEAEMIYNVLIESVTRDFLIKTYI